MNAQFNSLICSSRCDYNRSIWWWSVSEADLGVELKQIRPTEAMVSSLIFCLQTGVPCWVFFGVQPVKSKPETFSTSLQSSPSSHSQPCVTFSHPLERQPVILIKLTAWVATLPGVFKIKAYISISNHFFCPKSQILLVCIYFNYTCLLPAQKKYILTFDECKHIYSLTDDITSSKHRKTWPSLSCYFRSLPPDGVKVPPTSFCCTRSQLPVLG